MPNTVLTPRHAAGDPELAAFGIAIGGTLVVADDVCPTRNVPGSRRPSRIVADIRTLATGPDIRIDVKRVPAGLSRTDVLVTSIITSTDRVTIPSDGTTTHVEVTGFSQDFANGDNIRIDVEQIGTSGTTGGEVVLQLILERI